MAETAQNDQAEEKGTEISSAEAMLEMILMKEDDISQRVYRVESESQRQVEEAKLDAAHRKREVVAEEIGGDLREKELAKAHAEVEKISQDVQAQVREIKEKGKEHFDDAAKVVIEAVLPKLE